MQTHPAEKNAATRKAIEQKATAKEPDSTEATKEIGDSKTIREKIKKILTPNFLMMSIQLISVVIATLALYATYDQKEEAKEILKLSRSMNEQSKDSLNSMRKEQKERKLVYIYNSLLATMELRNFVVKNDKEMAENIKHLSATPKHPTFFYPAGPLETLMVRSTSPYGESEVLNPAMQNFLILIRKHNGLEEQRITEITLENFSLLEITNREMVSNFEAIVNETNSVIQNIDLHRNSLIKTANGAKYEQSRLLK